MRRSSTLAIALVACGCRPEATTRAMPSVEVVAPPVEVVAPPVEVPDALAELMASFAALREVRLAPSIEPPPWLRQGTLWLAVSNGCKPIWRTDFADVRKRELEYCRVDRRRETVYCRQPIDVDGSLRVLARHRCMYGESPAERARVRARGKGGGGGGGWSVPYAATSFAPRRDGPAYGRRGSIEWVPIAVEADHAVFAEARRFSLRASQARIEQDCAPGSIERARAQARLADPGATEAELEAALARRFGIGADGRRRCIVVEDERIEPLERSPEVTLDERVHNVPTQDVADCGEPCPEDQVRLERRRALLDATSFMAAASPRTMVVYRDRATCEAGSLRSTIVISDDACRR